MVCFIIAFSSSLLTAFNGYKINIKCSNYSQEKLDMMSHKLWLSCDRVYTLQAVLFQILDYYCKCRVQLLSETNSIVSDSKEKP